MKRSGFKPRTQPLRRDTGEAKATVPVLRMRKCKAPGCGEKFRPVRPLQVACSSDCAYAVGMQVRLKQDKAKDKERREKLMTLSDWRKRAQAAFNAYIRARDADWPCISCRRFSGAFDAGHYLSTGARPELRFDEANCHKQCVQCNQHLHGNLALYRLALIRRIGQEELDRLEGPNPPRHDTADSLKALAAHYRAKARARTKDQA